MFSNNSQLNNNSASVPTIITTTSTSSSPMSPIVPLLMAIDFLNTNNTNSTNSVQTSDESSTSSNNNNGTQPITTDFVTHPSASCANSSLITIKGINEKQSVRGGSDGGSTNSVLPKLVISIESEKLYMALGKLVLNDDTPSSFNEQLSTLFPDLHKLLKEEKQKESLNLINQALYLYLDIAKTVKSAKTKNPSVFFDKTILSTTPRPRGKLSKNSEPVIKMSTNIEETDFIAELDKTNLYCWQSSYDRPKFRVHATLYFQTTHNKKTECLAIPTIEGYSDAFAVVTGKWKTGKENRELASNNNYTTSVTEAVNSAKRIRMNTLTSTSTTLVSESLLPSTQVVPNTISTTNQEQTITINKIITPANSTLFSSKLQTFFQVNQKIDNQLHLNREDITEITTKTINSSDQEKITVRTKTAKISITYNRNTIYQQPPLSLVSSLSSQTGTTEESSVSSFNPNVNK